MSIQDFLRDSVERVAGELVEQKYPKLQVYGENPLIPIEDSYGEFEEYHTVEFENRMGNAALIAGCARDIPTVHIFRQKRHFTFKEVGNYKSWCLRDMKKMQAQGNTSSIKDFMSLQKQSLTETADKAALYGLTSAGLYGLFTQPYATLAVLPADGQLNNSGNGANSVRMVDKTDAQALRDLFTIAQYVRALSNEVDSLDTLAVAPDFHRRISWTVAPGITTGMTLLDFFLKAQEKDPNGIKRVIPLPHLKGQGALPNSDMIVGMNSSSGSIKHHTKAGVTFDEYQEGLDMCVKGTKSFGSTVSTNPLELLYATA